MFEVKGLDSSMCNDVVDVVVVATKNDPHALVVIDELREQGFSTIRFNLDDLRSSRIVSDLDRVALEIDGYRHRVDSHSAVWWRYTGQFDVGGLDDDEARLALDEAPYLLIGIFSAAGVRFVDPPFSVYRAEIKPLQLSAARRIGIRTPLTRLTNDPESARSFGATMRVVAKAVSPGVGIAPFVAEVRNVDMDYVTPLPTMLQEMVQAESDVRVVVVGTDAWIWNREREDTTTDWRQVDPRGEGFELNHDHEIEQQAIALTMELGISMAVQDWLQTTSGPVFLESNAQGAWLFLGGSESLVVPAIAKHLAGGR